MYYTYYILYIIYYICRINQPTESNKTMYSRQQTYCLPVYTQLQLCKTNKMTPTLPTNPSTCVTLQRLAQPQPRPAQQRVTQQKMCPKALTKPLLKILI